MKRHLFVMGVTLAVLLAAFLVVEALGVGTASDTAVDTARARVRHSPLDLGHASPQPHGRRLNHDAKS